MLLIANGLIALVALLHSYFLVLEVFFWDKPLGLRTFGQTPAQAAATKTLAINQGVYNGFLAAGLAWGLMLGAGGNGAKLFFLSCVIIAGVVGALTTKNRRILFVQTAPAALAAIFLLLA
jgi:putative membrane protein